MRQCADSLQLLTLEDFTGSYMGTTQGYLIYNQKLTGFTDIMEERYNYTVTNVDGEIRYKDYTQWYEPSESYFKKDVSFWTRMAQTVWSATGVGDLVDAALGHELITGDMNTLEESNWKVVEGMFETVLLCLPGVMNAGGGGKAVLCAVGKELGENMIMDTVYEAMEAGGCEEARSILNAVLIFRTIYSFVDMANSAVNAKEFKDAYKDKDWDDWAKKQEGIGKNSDAKANNIMDEVFDGTGVYSEMLEKVNSPDKNVREQMKATFEAAKQTKRYIINLKDLRINLL